MYACDVSPVAMFFVFHNDQDLNVLTSSWINFTQNEDISLPPLPPQSVSGAKDQIEKLISRNTCEHNL